MRKTNNLLRGNERECFDPKVYVRTMMNSSKLENRVSIEIKGENKDKKMIEGAVEVGKTSLPNKCKSEYL